MRSRPTTTTFPSGLVRQTSYDAASRVDVVTLRYGATTLQQFDYDYGFNADGSRALTYHNGQLVKVVELGGAYETYSYDDLHRLDRAERVVPSGGGASLTSLGDWFEEYEWDEEDNRTSLTTAAGTISGIFDAADQLTSWGDTSYSYDANGNTTGWTGGSAGTNSLVYDVANNWISGLFGTTSVENSYDGLGQQVSRTLGGTTTEAWHDLFGMSLQTTSSSTTSFLRGLAGSLQSITQETASGTSYHNYGLNGLGDVTALVSAAGGLINRYAYSPFGEVKESEGTATNPFGFRGGWWDAILKLLLAGAGNYLPDVGRTTQPAQGGNGDESYKTGNCGSSWLHITSLGGGILSLE